MNKDQNQEKVSKYISYSQLKTQAECKHLHWLQSVSKLKKHEPNQYTAYGIALENTLEKIFIESALGERTEDKDIEYFTSFLEQEIENVENIDEELLKQQYKAGITCIKNFELEFNKKFEGYHLLDTQKEIRKKIPYNHSNYIFYFISILDLLIKHNDKIIIIDYKTTNKGWSSFSKRDPLKLMQFYLYKLFYMTTKEYLGEEIECYYIFFNTQEQKIEIMEVVVTDDDLTWAYNKINSFIYNVYEKMDYKRNAVCGKYCECQKFIEQRGNNNV